LGTRKCLSRCYHFYELEHDRRTTTDTTVSKYPPTFINASINLLVLRMQNHLQGRRRRNANTHRRQCPLGWLKHPAVARSLECCCCCVEIRITSRLRVLSHCFLSTTTFELTTWCTSTLEQNTKLTNTNTCLHWIYIVSSATMFLLWPNKIRKDCTEP